MSPDCELCKQAQHRRCTSCFGAKYLSGDALKARCGAPIIVEIINPLTGDVVGLDKVSDVQLEVSHAWLKSNCSYFTSRAHIECCCMLSVLWATEDLLKAAVRCSDLCHGQQGICSAHTRNGDS